MEPAAKPGPEDFNPKVGASWQSKNEEFLAVTKTVYMSEASCFKKLPEPPDVKAICAKSGDGQLAGFYKESNGYKFCFRDAELTYAQALRFCESKGLAPVG